MSRELYLEYEQSIRALALDFFPSLEDAEDAIQEVNIKLLNTKPPEDVENEGGWMYVLVMNVLRDEYRKQHAKKRTPPTHPDDMVDYNDPYEYMAERELAVSIVDNYHKLPSDLRETCFLRYQKGLSYEAIARKLGVPTSTVGTRLMRAKELLS